MAEGTFTEERKERCCGDRLKYRDDGRFDLIIRLEKCLEGKRKAECEDVDDDKKHKIEDQINIKLGYDKEKNKKALHIKHVRVEHEDIDVVRIQADAYFPLYRYNTLWGDTKTLMKPVVEDVLGITGVEVLQPCGLCEVTVTTEKKSREISFTVDFMRPRSTKEGILESLEYLYEAVDEEKTFITSDDTIHPQSLSPTQYPRLEVTACNVKYIDIPESIVPGDKPQKKAVKEFQIVISKTHEELKDPTTMESIKDEIRQQVLDKVVDSV